MDNKKIGNFIADLRKSKNLTQQELGDKLYVTSKAVSKWERGLSFPDVSLLTKLADILDVNVSDILNGEIGPKDDINIEEVVNNKIKDIQKRQKTKMLVLIGIILFVAFSSFLGYFKYKEYHPDTIKIGDNPYSIGRYNLSSNGLNLFTEMIEKSKKKTDNYNISSLDVRVDRNCNIISFNLSINYFDSNYKYVGKGFYSYINNKLSYTYDMTNSLLVDVYSKTNAIDYISNNIKKIPLKKEIDVSGLNNYVISYTPSTLLNENTPIFDGRNNKKIKVLNSKQYNKGLGGKSKRDYYFVIRLNDGSSIVTGQQYLYVFDSDKSSSDNPSYMMEVDYYINNGKLMFTRDYGKSYIDTDITENQLNETLKFYRDTSLLTNSWFLSKDESLPIAYLYGEDPKLKISNDNGKSWSEKSFINLTDDYKPISQRVVGFTSKKFGYVALGTDWTMGSGEEKHLYFTNDSFNTYNEVEVPLNGTSHILLDVCMYDSKVGVIVLRDSMNSDFPLIYSTVSGGKSWSEVKYRESNLPDEITYLSDVTSITKEDGNYVITLGQGDTGTLKAKFISGDMMGWTYMSTSNSNVHTVG